MPQDKYVTEKLEQRYQKEFGFESKLIQRVGFKMT